MPDLLLWRRLTNTDFNAMNGQASPRGEGGGAMHVALGVNSGKLDVAGFLGIRLAKDKDQSKRVRTVGEGGSGGSLIFRRDADRRRGEWTIADQYSHRHPMWSTSAGFPSAFVANDAPVLLVFRIGGRFHVRLESMRGLARLSRQIPAPVLAQSKGVAPIDGTMLDLFPARFNRSLADLEQAAAGSDDPAAAFDPRDEEDGRRRILAAVVRRQGQRGFRRDLLKAYDGRCAITGETSVWVLEAAHIAPYRGTKSNHPSNGILLRADVHTLFDLHLISIDPHTGRVRTSFRLAATAYASFDGKMARSPARKAAKPNRVALANHYRAFEAGAAI